MSDWIQRWGDKIAAEPELPGVWKRKDGGYRVRGRAVSPLTGKLVEVKRLLPDCKRAREASVILEAELQRVRDAIPAEAATTIPRFASYAVTVFERKIADGTILSARGRDKWDWILRTHLIPAFGELFVDKITHEMVERWKASELLAERTKTKDEKRDRKLEGKRYRPGTANTILGVLRQVMSDASAAFNFADPCRRVRNADTRAHRTYTYEEPNALLPADVPRFLAEMRMRYPEHYAFAFLGFTTGLRPSSLRPLRRQGPNADVKWRDGKLLVRRSQTKGPQAMEATKTGRDQTIPLDPEQLSVLQWHVARLEEHAAHIERRNPEGAAALRASELLFPAFPSRWNKGGGFRAASALDKPFADVAERLQLGYPLSPRAMRRTYQDLARAAKVHDTVTRAISGHATPAMQQRYSTAGDSEVREALAAVIDIATGRRAA